MGRLKEVVVVDAVPMLLAPIPAVRKALERAGKTIDDMDIIEPNEAFASPLLQFADELGYDRLDPRVNPTGGAIALGHPIGASGVIYFGEVVHHLRRTGGEGRRPDALWRWRSWYRNGGGGNLIARGQILG